MGKANEGMDSLDIQVSGKNDEDKGKYFRLLIDPVEKATHQASSQSLESLVTEGK